MHLENSQTEITISKVERELRSRSLSFPHELVRKSVLVARDFCLQSKIVYTNEDILNKSIAILIDVKNGLSEIQERYSVSDILQNAVSLEQKQVTFGAANIPPTFKDEI